MSLGSTAPPSAEGPRVRVDPDAWWAFVAARAVPGVEVLGELTIRRPVRLDGRLVPVAVRLEPGAAVLVGPAGAQEALRRWVGADLPPAGPGSGRVRDLLPPDPLLDPLVAARPWLSVPGAVDGAELALKTVLGQQVSVPAARTLAGRLVSAFGEDAPDGLRAFPTAAAIARGDLSAVRALGLTGARAATLLALARALADGLDLSPAADHIAARRALGALPGIGPWTVEYVALRALRDADAFPAHDLVLRRMMGGLSAAEAARRAEAWRPWRGLAAQHLWTTAAAAPR